MPARRHAGKPTDRAIRPVDGVLLRFIVTDGPWAEDLPPVPEGFGVTVSFGSDNVAGEHRDALALLGYRVVDLPPELQLDISYVADALVSQELIDAHPRYWRSLGTLATRAYHLGLGPAAAAVGAIVRAHTATVRA